MMKKIVALTALCVAFESCSYRLANFSLVSTKSVDLKSLATAQVLSKTSTTDKVHLIILVPTRMINLNDAIDKAIEATPNCIALKDVVVRYKWFYIPYVYGQTAYVVEANPVVTAGSTGKLSSYSLYQLDSNGNMKVQDLSLEQYNASLPKALKTN